MGNFSVNKSNKSMIKLYYESKLFTSFNMYNKNN